MDSCSLLQGIFPTQGSNPGLPHCRRILHQLSHKGSPRILEWVAYPFSTGSSWLGNGTGVSCIAGRFFTNWAMRKAQLLPNYIFYNFYNSCCFIWCIGSCEFFLSSKWMCLLSLKVFFFISVIFLAWILIYLIWW